MADDVTGSVRFELPEGSVRVRGEPVVVLPAQALETLLHASPAASRVDMGRDVGYVMGRMIAARLGGSDEVRSAPIEKVVTELATEVAMLGLGLVHFERWGSALVVGISGGPLAKQTEMLAGLLGGAISSATGAHAAAISLPEGRYFVSNQRACDRMRSLLAGGMAWGDALAHLQQGGAS